jgi:hypothetical protein
MARMPKEPNERLLDLIHEAGFSHKGLARRINDLGKARGIPGLSYDHSSVIRWLKGEHPRDPAPKLAAEVFSLTLARPITEADLGFPKTHELPELGLRFTPSLPDTIETVTTLWRSDVERRQFIINATFAAGAYASSAIRWLTAPTTTNALTRPGRRVCQADVEAIREVTKTFLRLDNLFGGGRARPTVVRYLHDEVAPLLRQGNYSDSVREELFAATAELTRLAGWMAYDLEQHGLAQRYLIQALRLAGEAQDHALGGEILAGMSHQAVYVGQPDDGLDLARAAQVSAGRAGLPALLAESLIMEAHAHAVNTDTSACVRALKAAEHAFAKSPTETPAWLGYFDEAYMAAKFGHCFRELGNSTQAEHFARRSLDMADGYTRGRTFNVLLLANAHLQQRNLDEACAAGSKALDLAAGLNSARAIRYTRDLRRHMMPFDKQPSVREFQALAHELLPASDPGRVRNGHAA